MRSRRFTSLLSVGCLLCVSLASAAEDQSAARDAATVTKTHAWRPPFGIDAVGHSNVRGFDAAVQVSATPARHPLSAGVIFPKHGTLIACASDQVHVRLAVFDDSTASSPATFVTTLRDTAGKKEQVALQEPLVFRAQQRAEFSWSFVMPGDFSPRATLHLAILSPDGTMRWQTELLVVCPPMPVEWPEFGATDCHEVPVTSRFGPGPTGWVSATNGRRCRIHIRQTRSIALNR